MSAKKDIMKILNKRKTGMTSVALTTRLPEFAGKTIRNTLGTLITDGAVTKDDFQYLQNDRYVDAYRAA